MVEVEELVFCTTEEVVEVEVVMLTVVGVWFCCMVVEVVVVEVWFTVVVVEEVVMEV